MKCVIKLNNDVEKAFPTSENETYRFYRCLSFDEAVSLQMTLTDLGNACTIDDDTYGWFVRVNK